MKTTYTTDDGDLVIEFDYQPAEADTQFERGCKESADIYSVMAGNFEILDWCGADSIKFFEAKCLEAVAFSRECSEIDKADAAHARSQE